MTTDRTSTPAERVDLIQREVAGVKAQYGITSWEDVFMGDIAARSTLSPKQEARLRQIEIKVFGADHDPHTGSLIE